MKQPEIEKVLMDWAHELMGEGATLTSEGLASAVIRELKKEDTVPFGWLSRERKKFIGFLEKEKVPHIKLFAWWPLDYTAMWLGRWIESRKSPIEQLAAIACEEVP